MSILNYLARLVNRFLEQWSRDYLEFKIRQVKPLKMFYLELVHTVS